MVSHKIKSISGFITSSYLYNIIPMITLKEAIHNKLDQNSPTTISDWQYEILSH